ncbi:glycosyltransferase [Nesterenkonia haasae]|uniref:glycosyltransferase n=1 Tax=Nesterenkonia haasae TaxID=2587813 RepID=UPI00139161DB|nr:glycosyltransferase [Nesterenkonia haasae]NDK31720.1 glycosyltransferase family 1 protein [Nesterenkonia haasae]
MRVVLATYGTRGDVEPVVALATQVRAMGAEVKVCAPPDEEFAQLMTRAKLPFVPFGKPWSSWANGVSTAEERVEDADEFVARHIAATYEILAEAAQGCDLLLATGMLHFIAQSVAEKLSIPHRFVLFSPGLELESPERDRLVGAPINAHRTAIGLPPVDDIRQFLFTDQPWMAADPVLAPQRASGRGSTVRTPAWILRDDRPVAAELMAFLDAGAPPVYVGFGSMRITQDSARAAIEAIRAKGRRVLLRRGWADLAAIDDQDDCFIVGDVNQQALFPRVAAIMHHGGAGTTTTAALAGTPQVVVPQAADQPYQGLRVAELGIGAAHEGSTPSFESLSGPLTIALDPETRARATALAGAIRTDGATVAARLLLDTANAQAKSFSALNM